MAGAVSDPHVYLPVLRYIINSEPFLALSGKDTVGLLVYMFLTQQTAHLA